MTRKLNDEGKEAELPDYTSPVEMEEGVSDKNMIRIKNDEEKEAEFPYYTSPFDMQEGVNDIRDEKNEKTTRKKRQNDQMTLPLLICRKV